MNTPHLDRRALLLGTFALLAGCGQSKASPAPSWKGADLADKGYGKDFRLKDTSGRERTLADWRGKAVLLHFGFTQCPDACPTMLARAVEVRKMLGAQKDKLQVVFITLDPERDTPELLAAYMAAFDPSFVALRGDLAQTKEVARHFKVFFQKVQTGSTYTLDHSTLGFAFDPAGHLRVGVRHIESAEDCAHDMKLLLA